MDISRRSVLRGIGAASVTLTFTGFASAGSGGAQYIVVGGGRGVVNRIENAGFEVRRELAGGSVLQVAGPEADRGDLEAVRGVQQVARNASFELEGPELVEELDVAAEADALPAFWENQWDKHVTDVEDAHGTATGEGARVAVLDTGIDPDHPDLAANVNEELSELFSSGDPLDDHPWDVDGHGTHVAGTVAATGDVGVIGTAPDAELVSAKVFWVEEVDGEFILTTTTADILAAIDYAAEIGADAANMSLGTPPLPPEYNQYGIRVAYERVIQHATRRGTVIVASAGNSTANLQQGGFFTTPNSTAGALSVSATAPDDGLSYYSNYGTNEIDAGAPGGGYNSLADTLVGYQEWLEADAPPLISLDPREEGEEGTLWLDEDGLPTTNPDAVVDVTTHPIPAWPVPFNFVFSTVPDEGYAWYAGTSMAAPQVSGLVALVRELDPDANANQVEQAIKHGADGTNGNSDPELGAGRINAKDTVDRVS